MNKIIVFFYVFLLGFVKSEMKFEVEYFENNNITFKNVYYQNNKNEQISFSLINIINKCECSELKKNAEFFFVNNKLFFFVNIYRRPYKTDCFCMLKIDNRDTHFDFILFEEDEISLNINYWKYLLNKSNKYDVIIWTSTFSNAFHKITRSIPLYLEIDKINEQINKDIKLDINYF